MKLGIILGIIIVIVSLIVVVLNRRSAKGIEKSVKYGILIYFGTAVVWIFEDPMVSAGMAINAGIVWAIVVGLSNLLAKHKGEEKKEEVQ